MDFAHGLISFLAASKSIIGLIVIAVIAIFGSRTFEKKTNIPDLFSRFFSNGLVYLILGFAMGPSLLGLIDTKLISQLSPVITVGLFWIGFLFGINLKFKDLKRITAPVYILALGQAFFVLLVIAPLFMVLFRYFSAEVGLFYVMASAITLAACASGTGQATLLRLSKSRNFRGPTAQVSIVSATLDDIPAIITAGLVTFFLHLNIPGQPNLPGVGWAALGIGISLLGGFVIGVLFDYVNNEQSRILVVIGVMAIGGGLSAYLNLSPLFIGAVMGMTYVNLTDRDDKVFEIVTRYESTLYVLFLLLVGGMVHIKLENLLIYTGIYVVVRIFAKFAGSSLFNVKSEKSPKASPLIGLTLLSQGGMAIALAIHFMTVYNSPLTDTVVSVVIFGILLSEFFASPAALWVVKRGKK